MASTYTAAGIELIAQGEQAGAWGDTTNTNWELVEEMIGGVVDISLTGSTYSLSTSDGASSEGRHSVLNFSGSPGATCTVTVTPNDMQKVYFVVNGSDETVTISQGSGANVSVSAGKNKIVFCDGAGAGAAVTDISSGFDATTLAELGVTASAAELNTMDGITATTAELNTMDGITATTAELNTMDGITATAAELNILDGATLDVTELNYVDGVTSAIQTQLDAKAPLASPTLTGTPLAPTATAGTNTTQIATTAFVGTAVSNLVDSAPAALDTLNELAAALGDDANFSTTVTNSIATKVAKAGDTMTGALNFGDSVKAQFGASNDLQIYHDGSNSRIYENGTGNLLILADNFDITNSAGTEYKAQFATNGAATLYYDNAVKLATTSTGIDVTGNVTVSGTVDGRDVATDGTKLDGIESGATADQTAQEIATAIDADATAETTLKSALGLGSLAYLSTVDASTITDNSVGAAELNVTGNGTTSQFLRSDGDGTFTWATPTDTNTTYSAGAGLDLTGTTFSIETDLRDGITHMGLDTNDYIYQSGTDIRYYIDGSERARMVNSGDFHADGDVIAYSTTISDERLKENIVGIDSALDKVAQLNGYTFTYKADGKISAGVIAQEVEKVLPEAVSEKELPLKADDGVEYKVVNYDALHGLLIEAIKELKAEIEVLKGAK